MYNSRPRYNKYASEFNVPENYAGNAFREEIASELVDKANVAQEPYAETSSEVPSALSGTSEDYEKEKSEDCSGAPKKKGVFPNSSGFGFDVSKIFRGGLGFEELLIIGLILLVSQGDNNDDIMLLLILLLFVQ